MKRRFWPAAMRMLWYPQGETAPPSPFLDGQGTSLIFDNLRNVMIAVVLAQAGIYAVSIELSSGCWHYLARSLGWVLLGAFAALFLLNLFHGEQVLRHSPHFASLRARQWLFNVCEKLYWGLSFGALMAGFVPAVNVVASLLRMP